MNKFLFALLLLLFISSTVFGAQYIGRYQAFEGIKLLNSSTPILVDTQTGQTCKLIAYLDENQKMVIDGWYPIAVCESQKKPEK
jgi:hypothetical protein